MRLLEDCLRSVIRRMVFRRGGTRLLKMVSRHYVDHYAGRDDRSIVLDDFDGDLKFRVDRASYVGSLIYWRGYHSITELMCLERYLKPEMVFADVGANQGEFTVFAAKRLTAGTVLAFEPVGAIYRRLVENVELNQFSNVLAYNFGLADQPREVELFTSEDSPLEIGTNEGLGTMFRSADRNVPLDTARVEVFDKVFRGTGLERLDGMKIDVEGAELFVLRGSLESIKRHRPFILLEINEETFQAAGYSTADVVSLFRDLGYQMSVIGPWGKQMPASAEDLPAFCHTIWMPCTSC